MEDNSNQRSSDNLKNQIDKFVGNKTNESQLFLIQVGERGSENILRNGCYRRMITTLDYLTIMILC